MKIAQTQEQKKKQKHTRIERAIPSGRKKIEEKTKLPLSKK